jgi:hypothetical protein
LPSVYVHRINAKNTFVTNSFRSSSAIKAEFMCWHASVTMSEKVEYFFVYMIVNACLPIPWFTRNKPLPNLS